MKKAVSMLLAGMMILTLAACGSQPASASQSASTPQPASASQPTSASQPAPTESTTEQPEQNGEGSKTLIVYFTPANSDTADAVSGATPRTDGLSSVEYLVQKISAQVSADAAKIVPVNTYPLPYQETADLALEQQHANERPAFTLDVNPEEYDVLFIGYPVWWYHLPMIMQTFFDTYDFSGKTIIPFNTHQGSRDSGTYKDIAGLEPDALVLEGLNVNGERVESADSSVKDWLNKLGY